MDVKQFKLKEEKYLVPALIAFCLIILEVVFKNTLLKNLT